jgi:[protein-PII] uridylyltransferase
VSHQLIIPTHLIAPLAITAAKLSTADICELNQAFLQWQQQQFVDEDITQVIAARAQYIDNVLIKLWCQHNLDEYQITLIAVGGYGRGELHPYSDVDILLLTQQQTEPQLEQKISSFITQLWDIKLDIGHSVRSIKECIKQAINDVTVATNLMEMRQICGNEALLQHLQLLINEDELWNSQRFFIAKCEEQQQRHKQYHGAAYTLEPNLKANPGGLRDIQTIGWVAKRHFNADSLEELVEHDYLTTNEYYELLECQDYLWRMRCALHFIARRSENRLLFDYQADVAQLMGFGDGGKVAIERMMKRFFRIIGRVAELNKMLLQHFEYAIVKNKQHQDERIIDDDFVVLDGQIKATNNRVFTRSTKIMEVFLIIASTPEITDLHPQTLRLMRNARRRLVSGMVDYAECRRLFMAIIKHPQGLGLAFTLMHRHSIIGAYLPEWRNIVGQMQFDLFHAYSVDEHSYRLIKNLYRFSQKEHNDEFPLCSKIMQRIRKPEVLFLAGIFHDIAKGRGGDHAKLGAIDALNFSKSHQINDHDGRMISWLVKQHLLMSVTAQRRDISNPEVIKNFADVVRDEAHLDYLYCLTVADMRATNESLWNSWKANLLKELYVNTKRAFLHGLEKPVDLRSKIRENQQQALIILDQKKCNALDIKSLWLEFKADYFLRYAPEQIAWHTQHILTHDKTEPLVLISSLPYRGGTEVFVYTKSKANIFASIVNTLGAKRLSIHDAKIITSKTGYTVNTFVVLDQQGVAINDSHRSLDISKTLTRILAEGTFDRLNSQKGIERLPTKLKQFTVKPQVSFIETKTKNTTLIEIVALDHPGLLADIAEVFFKQKIQIHSAKITTFGEKAEDVFIVSNSDNEPLSEQEQHQLSATLCAGQDH